MEPSFKITQHFEEASGDEFCPQAPPRYKRKVKIRGVANLNLENISNNDFTHQNDIFFRTDSLQNLAEETESIKGRRRIYPISHEILDSFHLLMTRVEGGGHTGLWSLVRWHLGPNFGKFESWFKVLMFVVYKHSW